MLNLKVHSSNDCCARVRIGIRVRFRVPVPDPVQLAAAQHELARPLADKRLPTCDAAPWAFALFWPGPRPGAYRNTLIGPVSSRANRKV